MPTLREEFEEVPFGWRWSSGSENLIQINNWPNDRHLTKEVDPFHDLIRSFFSWAEDNDLGVCRYDRSSIEITLEDHPDFRYCIYPYYSYYVYRKGETPGGVFPIEDKEFDCGSCGHTEKTESSIFCHECATLFYCMNCQRNRTAVYYDPTSGMTHCESCGIKCDCGRYHGGYMSVCTVCQPVYKCENCGCYETEEPYPVSESREEKVCNACRDLYCHRCDRFTYGDETMHLDDDGLNICSRCYMLGDDGDNEIFDEVEMEATKLRLPTIPGREMIRLSGVEIEGGIGRNRNADPNTGDRGANILARRLYDKDLSGTYRQVGYHHGEGFARVETDASCDWECVIGPINMADVSHVRKLNNVVKIIKQTIKEDYLKLDLRCGTHIHVGAEKVALGNAYNLHLLYTYMEDVMYRLGAANWPIHRTLLHDENHSAARSPKEDSKTKFARRFHGNRYYGLSFNNYFERMLSSCRCGAAQYGAFEECSCNLSKCTFEFRLFNATANTIKLHAYLALCQALVAKAISMPEIKDPNLFEQFPFEMSRYRDMPADKQAEMIGKWTDRLSYIATELPLTDDERKSIFYCIKNSDLAKVDNAETLFNPQTTMEVSN